MDVLPLPDAQVVEVLAPAGPPELVRTEHLLLLPQVAPEVEVGDEVAVGVGEAGVVLAAASSWPSGARVGPGSTARPPARAPRRTQPWRSASRIMRPRRGSTGRRGEPATELGEPDVVADRPVLDGAELLEEQDAVLDGAVVGRLDEREAGDVAEAERRHLEDDRRQVRAQDLRLGELRAGVEVVLGVEADAGAGRRRGRSGRPAGRPTPARSARSAAAAPSCAGCSARCGRCPDRSPRRCRGR